MKILKLCTFDRMGGAAIAGYRLHKSLLYESVNSKLMVQFQERSDQSIISNSGFWGHLISWIRTHVDGIPLKFYNNRLEDIFSPAWVPDFYSNMIRDLDPDILHAHWITGGYITLKTLEKSNKPIIWTLHDMWAFSGGCHYSGDCSAYLDVCGRCPVLQSNNPADLSNRIWKRKNKRYSKMDLTIVTPSNWLGKLAKQSSLLKNKRVEVIKNGLDLEIFRPFDKKTARDILQLPQDKKLILFGALGEVKNRKGGDLLMDALEHLVNLYSFKDYEIVLFGGIDDSLDVPIKQHTMGRLTDEQTLSLLYSSVDAFVAPSRQDNLPNTILEALACGTPSIAFDIGGIPDLINHKKTGYLVHPFDTEDLAQGINWVLEDQQRHQLLSNNCRKKAEKEFDSCNQARQYISLYEEILR